MLKYYDTVATELLIDSSVFAFLVFSCCFSLCRGWSCSSWLVGLGLWLAGRRRNPRLDLLLSACRREARLVIWVFRCFSECVWILRLSLNTVTMSVSRGNEVCLTLHPKDNRYLVLNISMFSLPSYHPQQLQSVSFKLFDCRKPSSVQWVQTQGCKGLQIKFTGFEAVLLCTYFLFSLIWLNFRVPLGWLQWIQITCVLGVADWPVINEWKQLGSHPDCVHDSVQTRPPDCRSDLFAVLFLSCWIRSDHLHQVRVYFCQSPDACRFLLFGITATVSFSPVSRHRGRQEASKELFH